MLKSFSLAVTILAAGVLTGSAMAQQSGNTQSAPAKSAPATQSQTAPDASSASIPGLPTQKDKVSYAIGMNLGERMHKDGVDIDPEVLAHGMKDALSGGTPAMTADQVRSSLTDLRNQLAQKQMAAATKPNQMR